MKNKRIKKGNSFTFLLVVFAGLLAIFLIAVYFNKASNNFYDQSQITNNSNGAKVYKSKDLKFSINVPAGFQIEDKFAEISLSNSKGVIHVSRNGTNYNKLADYITNFDKRRNLIVSEMNIISIDGLEAMSRIVKFPEENIEQKSYYVYVQNMVYIFSTSSEALFSDLDKIVQSFKYTP